MRYQVLVGNIGTVYEGNKFFEANKVYNDYVRLSKQKFGRAAGEDVTWLKGEYIYREHAGWRNSNL